MSTVAQSFDCVNKLKVENREYSYFDLKAESLQQIGGTEHLPFSIKILLENLLRHQQAQPDSYQDIKALLEGATHEREILFHPARVLMQDFTGVPAIVDLAAMREALVKRGADPDLINPLTPVDLVIDHSVNIDQFASTTAFEENVKQEMVRNRERYQFLKWGQTAFNNFRVVPPGAGICHQVNLEYLAKTVWSEEQRDGAIAYPDTLVGTDSHTTMINGLGVLGWGVGGIEAEAAMLGQPISMLIPEVVGFEFTGQLRSGITATDLVLTVVEMLRDHGVVGKFVEFYGSGLHSLTLADRATIANMAPEYGATCGFFPVDQKTLDYMVSTGRSPQNIRLVESYCKAQGMWHDRQTPAPVFSEQLSLDLNEVEASLAGPHRPQDRITLSDLKSSMETFIELKGVRNASQCGFDLAQSDDQMHHGDLVIAAITSCTNTSNPAVMLAAGLVARKAVNTGLKRKPWVKTSLAPGSRVVTDYLVKSGLQRYLDELGFHLVGYGCTTCIGNSGPLPDNVSRCVQDNQLVVSAVLSGNRNFEGRIHPLVQANWLASPPLVVIFALAGTTLINLEKDPIGYSREGQAIFLRDLWPSQDEIQEAMSNIETSMFTNRYAQIFNGDEVWDAIQTNPSATYDFPADSTYIRLPPFFEPKYIRNQSGDIEGARILALFGDSITTDHISPAGAIPLDSPAANYLREHGVEESEFNSFGSRRGNHEVMMRGTFGNIRIRNLMVPGTEGGYTRIAGSDKKVTIYEAAMHYRKQNTATVVFAGAQYGTGSSRDWAAKGTLLLGVKAVIASSFERIHRANLVGMGVLPLQLPETVSVDSLELSGDEKIDITGLEHNLSPKQTLRIVIRRSGQQVGELEVSCRLDTATEVAYYEAGGILPYVLESILETK